MPCCCVSIAIHPTITYTIGPVQFVAKTHSDVSEPVINGRGPRYEPQTTQRKAPQVNTPAENPINDPIYETLSNDGVPNYQSRPLQTGRIDGRHDNSQSHDGDPNYQSRPLQTGRIDGRHDNSQSHDVDPNESLIQMEYLPMQIEDSTMDKDGGEYIVVNPAGDDQSNV